MLLNFWVFLYFTIKLMFLKSKKKKQYLFLFLDFHLKHQFLSILSSCVKTILSKTFINMLVSFLLSLFSPFHVIFWFRRWCSSSTGCGGWCRREGGSWSWWQRGKNYSLTSGLTSGCFYSRIAWKSGSKRQWKWKNCVHSQLDWFTLHS